MSLFPYLMLTVLVVRGATLEGAARGVTYYVKPDMAKLANPTVGIFYCYMFFCISSDKYFLSDIPIVRLTYLGEFLHHH